MKGFGPLAARILHVPGAAAVADRPTTRVTIPVGPGPGGRQRRAPKVRFRSSGAPSGSSHRETPEGATGGVVQAPTDEELVLALARGHTDSLGSLVARWEQPLFRFVYRLLERREDARDVCQETFLRVLRGAADFREGARFSTWMYQIALNLCRDQVRRRARWRLRVVESLPAREDGPPIPAEAADDAALPDDALDARRRERAVHDALRDLPPEQREVVFLKEFEGLKFREIADVLGCPESTVKSRMYFALGAMRRNLSRRGLAS